MMAEISRTEALIKAWVKLSGMIKNTRITKGLVYNEAIIMMLIYERYQKDGKGIISIKELTQETKMLKSLVNRTVNSLEKKGFLERCNLEDASDKRMVYVKCVEQELDKYLIIHNGSLELAKSIIETIGNEDADTFIRLVKKIEDADYKL